MPSNVENIIRDKAREEKDNGKTGPYTSIASAADIPLEDPYNSGGNSDDPRCDDWNKAVNETRGVIPLPQCTIYPKIAIGYSYGIPGLSFSKSYNPFTDAVTISGPYANGINTGVSLDLTLGEGPIEASFGSSKYSSIGVLLSPMENKPGYMEVSGAAIHFGPGWSLVPINVTYPYSTERPKGW
jgi:hypothetical protein